ncbi:MAG: hypothetical protein ACRDYA_11525 [Egibacteraceae bacterium]
MQRYRSIFALALLLIVMTTACGGGDPRPPAATAPAESEESGAALPAAELALMAYSTPQEANDGYSSPGPRSTVSPSAQAPGSPSARNSRLRS